MGRKKGKQAGAFGSKRLRHAAETRRHAERRDDLRHLRRDDAALHGSSEDETPYRGVFSHSSYHHGATKRKLATPRAATSSSAAADLRAAGLLAEVANTRSLVPCQQQPPVSEVVADTLFVRCCLAIGASLHLYGPGLFEACFREVLPVHAVELIARCASVDDSTIRLVAHPESRVLDIRGPSLTDAAAIDALVARRTNWSPPPQRGETRSVVPVPECWDDDDANGAITRPRRPPLIARGCPRLVSLTLDAPVTHAFFGELGGSCATALEALALGPLVPPCERALRTLVLTSSAFAALRSLDLSHPRTSDAWRRAFQGVALACERDASTDAVFLKEDGDTTEPALGVDNNADDAFGGASRRRRHGRRSLLPASSLRRPAGPLVVRHRWGVCGGGDSTTWRPPEGLCRLAGGPPLDRLLRFVHVDDDRRPHGQHVILPSYAPLLRQWDGGDHHNNGESLLALPVAD